MSAMASGSRIRACRKARRSRDAYAQMVGEDGFALLDALEAPEAPEDLRELPIIDDPAADLAAPLRAGHGRGGGARSHPAMSSVRFKANRELPPAAEGIESPYDAEARYRHKRDTQWTGYMVHVSETCEPTAPHLLTHVHTTTAAVHEAQCTAPIHQALSEKDLAPREHFVDGAYISADLLVHQPGRARHHPARPHAAESKAGKPRPTGPTISTSSRWIGSSSRRAVPRARSRPCGGSMSIGRASRIPWSASASRTAGPVPPGRSAPGPQDTGRRLHLPSQEHFEALQAARAWYASEEGRQRYQRRAGVEGTLSQGVRAFGLRRTRYRGLAKTHLQHVAIAAAINIDRIVAWLDERPRATTRTSRFAALAPVHDLPSETPAV